MLPRLIKDHPYFHDNINIDQAKLLVEKAEVNKGTFLFCYASQDNSDKFQLICKGKYGDEVKIRTYDFVYHANLFGVKGVNIGADGIFSGLDNIILFVKNFRSPFRGFLPNFHDFVFEPIPVFNRTTQARLQLPYTNYLMPPLGNDTVNLTIQYLDAKSLVATATVSKSWHTLFGKNLLKVFQMKEQVVADKIKEDQKRREHENAIYLLNRYGSSGLE